MKKALLLSTLFLSFGSLLTTQVAYADDHSSHQHSHKHEHKGTESSKQADSKAFNYAYTAIYSLKAGEEYTIVVGHTHEHELHLGMVLSKQGVDARVEGNKLFATKAIEVKNTGKFDLKPGSLYELELAHKQSEFTFKVPADGKYIIYTDSPSNKYLPFELQDSKENLLVASYEHVISNVKAEIYNGYFDDSMVQDRELSDWYGSWTSVYPYLLDGTLDPVWEHKAKNSTTMDAKQWKEYYTAGYKTDVAQIIIEKGNKVTFVKDDGSKVTGTYVYDGKTTLNYSKGNRGVRFQFKQTDPNSKAPKFMQFSDHNIYPSKVNHFHLFWGDTSQLEINKELVNWPTYYPSSYKPQEVLSELLNH